MAIRKGFCFGKGGKITSSFNMVRRGTVKNPDRRSLTEPSKVQDVMARAYDAENFETPPAPKGKKQ